MLDSLFEKYESINAWESYYRIPIKTRELFPTEWETVQRDDRCNEFIKTHFVAGGKGEVFRLDFEDSYNLEGKHSHTVALYLLGLHLKEFFFGRIENGVKSIIPSAEEWYREKEFMYTWFLTALYHDIASCIERKEGASVDDIEEVDNIISNIIPKEADKCHRYPKTVVQKYYNYRKSDQAKDHGIIGGALLYSRLMKIFKEKTKDHDWEQAPCKSEGCLEWRLDHTEHYKYVADAITCHNIWSVQKDDEKSVKKYEHVGLEDLIIKSDKQKLSIDDYPLHFMLCLLDSIEPVKRFSKFSAREVLENVAIDYVQEHGSESNKNQDYIRISWSEKMKTDLGFWDWMKNIHSLQDWMNVKISSCQCGDLGCSLTIEIMRRDNNRKNKRNI